MQDDSHGSPNVAFGHPGIPPTWSPGSKDGIGTAYSQASRVWFTLAMGILTEIYYPTIDRPQIRDAQFLITDGETFFHEEKRDLIAHVERIEADTLGYRLVSADPEGRYTLTKEIIADPHQPCVLVHTNFAVAPEWQGKLRIYFLLAPHLEGAGWGNSAKKVKVAGRHVLAAWKNHTHLALGSDHSFLRASCGFVGSSDGWQDLHDNFKMDWEFDRADDGNIALMGEIDLGKGNEFTVAIAFGDSLHAAVAGLSQSLALPFAHIRTRFIEQWQRVGAKIRSIDQVSTDGGHLSRTSGSLLLAHEDKTFAGALIASASIPWGDAMGDDDLGGYHLVWTRDMVNSATALQASGDHATPLRALIYLACSQQPDGGFPQNFWIDGTPYWKGIQLDEVAFPIILAWRLWQENALENFDPWPLVKSAAGYLILHGPRTQQERWEESSGYSPSTIATNITALICAADLARAKGESESAHFMEDFADFLETNVEKWTVTTQGSVVPEIPRHYIRILPASVHDIAPLEDPNTGTIGIPSRPPGEPWEFPAKDIVDAGFLELVRYGIRKAGSELMEDSLRVIDTVLKVETPFGPCWRRYNHDGYGNHADGKPYTGWGEGRAWPLLTGERAHYELAAGRDVRPFITTMENFASNGGLLPEQVWDQPDIPKAFMYFGKPCGSAMPLMWAHAEYIKLLRSVADGQVFDRIAPVADRYLQNRGRKDLELWKPMRRVRSMQAGKILRVLLPGTFRLRWSTDEWQTSHDQAATLSGLRLGFVDIATAPGQTSSIHFEFLETEISDLGDTTFHVQVDS
jgi:glucoamylase